VVAGDEAVDDVTVAAKGGRVRLVEEIDGIVAAVREVEGVRPRIARQEIVARAARDGGAGGRHFEAKEALAAVVVRGHVQGAGKRGRVHTGNRAGGRVGGSQLDVLDAIDVYLRGPFLRVETNDIEVARRVGVAAAKRAGRCVGGAERAAVAGDGYG